MLLPMLHTPPSPPPMSINQILRVVPATAMVQDTFLVRGSDVLTSLNVINSLQIDVYSNSNCSGGPTEGTEITSGSISFPVNSSISINTTGLYNYIQDTIGQLPATSECIKVIAKNTSYYFGLSGGDDPEINVSCTPFTTQVCEVDSAPTVEAILSP